MRLADVVARRTREARQLTARRPGKREAGLETAYCAETVAITYEEPLLMRAPLPTGPLTKTLRI
jgi:hypothetical protein